MELVMDKFINLLHLQDKSNNNINIVIY